MIHSLPHLSHNCDLIIDNYWFNLKYVLMKALKITLLLFAVAMLTVSGVQTKDVPATEDPSFKEYSPKDLLAIDKKKLKAETHG